MFRVSHLVFIFVLIVITKTEDKEHVYIRVYYESKCSDSRNFVIQQLQPAVETLAPFIDIEFIPFGKAFIRNNNTEIVCQHGPPECMGNLVQACTLNLLEGRVDNVRKVKYVACELSTEASTRKHFQCVRQSGANVRMVEECISSGKGSELQLKNERKTKLINPKFIPTVTFDGEFDQQIQDLSMQNLIRTICSYFNYSVRPCKLRLKKVYDIFVKQQNQNY